MADLANATAAHVAHLEHQLTTIRLVLDDQAVAARELEGKATHHDLAADVADIHGQGADALAHRADARIARAQAEQIRLCRVGLLGALRGEPATLPGPRVTRDRAQPTADPERA